MKLSITSRDETGLSTLEFDFTSTLRDLGLDKFKDQYYITFDAGNQHSFKISLFEEELRQLRIILGMESL
jgi:hypothetical protein